MSVNVSTHRWRFFRAGGFDQVRLDRGADLVNLAQLDQKLWVALSCPTQGVELDPVTLKLIDSDVDGRVRSPELIEAIEWAAGRLKSPDTLVSGGPLALSSINDATAEGRLLLAAARRILQSLGKGEALEISVDDCADNAAIFAGMACNGDGVIGAEGQEPATQAAIQTLIEQWGGVQDRSGAVGVDRATIDRFFQEAEALRAWRQDPRATVAGLPAGTEAEAFAALSAVRGKVDDFYLRCHLSAFDPRAAALLNGSEDDLRGIGAQLLSGAGQDDIAALPLAFVGSGAALPLDVGVNPVWAPAVSAFHRQVVLPWLGALTALSEADWRAVVERFAGHEAWLAEKPVTVLDAMAPQALADILDSDTHARLLDLVAQDEAAADEAALIGDVERLVRYVRDLARLANNFVSFADFYTGREKASFQAGTLYLDGRSCDLCVKVLDAGKHAALAELSGVYLAYCDLVRAGETMTIAAALTAGDADQLMVGRNGVFYDRQGRDWHATVTKIVDHPISIRQAFWTPYKKVSRLIGEQFQKLAADKAKSADELATQAVAKTGDKISASAAAPAAAPAAFDMAKFAGIFAALGLAIGAIGTALASVITGFMGLQAWQMPLALLGIVLLISGPSMAMAFFKLRNRNLGPILDANGWAVNTRARINIPFGSALTQVAKLPEDADRALTDPYAESATPWRTYAAVALVVIGVVVYLSWTGELPTLLAHLNMATPSAQP